MVLGMTDEPLDILHVFRAPVGGLYRHVLDLSRGQIERGHRVGFIADSTTGGERALQSLAEIEKDLAHGVMRMPVDRYLKLSDMTGVRLVSQRVAETGAQVIHGHGAKGGAFARLARAPKGTVRAYTPHGGSLLFKPNAVAGKFYLTLEAILARWGNLYLFESQYSANVFRAKLNEPRGLVRVIHNGIGPADLELVSAASDATDIVFIGELRPVKGIDILLQAIHQMHREGEPITATIVGGGPSDNELHSLTRALGLEKSVRFFPPTPAREAFSFGRLMVVPSRSESFPYIVLEAIGAGIPLVTTAVGGIPEIYGPESSHLVTPNDSGQLVDAIRYAKAHTEETREISMRLRDRIRDKFSIDTMVNGVLRAYRETLQGV
jgi:glycosyltransferase involved in cell wall biosynthesis